MIILRKLLAISLLCCLLIMNVLGEERPSYITQYTFGSRDEKRIAITIDDWFEPDLLPEFLDLAAEYNCKFTLYPIGVNIFPRDKDNWQRALDEGHELGNHSNTHKNLDEASRTSILAQLNNMEDRLEKTLGYRHEMNTVRYPYGACRQRGTKSAFAKVINEAGYEHVALWDVDSTDAKEILKKTQNGSIILLHGRKKDLRALKVILPKLQAEGYEIVTISDLLGLKPSQKSQN
ncbi:MAG: polysaccharide deacetylase family protein [Clostridiales bacterium]|nr:polysaccharide deacetylase family protein [Clostridiales bacterium]